MKLKRLLSALLVFAMVLSLCPVIAFAATEPTITWTQETVDEANGIYKLVGHVESTYGVQSITTALNFDHSVIQPVDADTHTSVELTAGGDVPGCVLGLLQTGTFQTIPGFGQVPVMYSPLCITKISSERTSVELTQYYPTATADMNTDADYMEFYFRVIEGKTVDATTFKFASLNDADPVAIAVQDANDPAGSWYHYDDWNKAYDKTLTHLNNFSLTYEGSQEGVVDVDSFTGSGEETLIYFKYLYEADGKNGTDKLTTLPINTTSTSSNYVGKHAQMMFPASVFSATASDIKIGAQAGKYITKLEFVLSGHYHENGENDGAYYRGDANSSKYKEMLALAERMKDEIKLGKITVKLGTIDRTIPSCGEADDGQKREQLSGVWEGASSYYVPDEELTQVFSGNPYIVPYDDVAAGDQGANGQENDWFDILVIELDEPFLYTGQAIVIDVVMDESCDISDFFQCGREGFAYREFTDKMLRMSIGNDEKGKSYLPRTKFYFTDRSERVTLSYNPDEVLTTDGTGKRPTVTVHDNELDKDLVEGTDYTVSYTGTTTTTGAAYSGYNAPTQAGKYTMTLTFKGGYSGTKTVDFTVQQGFNVEITIPSQTWTGEPLTPVVTVKYVGVDDYELKLGSDYTMVVNGGADCIDAGEYSVMVYDTKSSAFKEAVFEIIGVENSVNVSMEGWIYGSDPKSPVASATYGTPVIEYQKSGTGNWTSTKPTDAGDYLVRASVSASGGYSYVEKVVPFTISAQDVTGVEKIPMVQTHTANRYTATNSNVPFKVNIGETSTQHGQVILKKEQVVFNTNEQVHDLTAMVGQQITSMTLYYSHSDAVAGISRGNMTVLMGPVPSGFISFTKDDYYANNMGYTKGYLPTNGFTEVFSGEVIVNEDGNGNGTVTLNFQTPYTYTGDDLLIDFTGILERPSGADAYKDIKWKGNKAENPNLSYSYDQSSNVHTAGPVPQMTFTCDAMVASVVTAAQLSDQTLLWNGQPQAPTLIVTDGDKSLVEGTDYDVTYGGSTTAPSAAGTHTATLTFKGNYKGTKTVTYTVSKSDIQPTLTIENWHVGDKPKQPVLTGADGAVTYTYAPVNSSTFTEVVPTAEGTYKVKATIAETANSNGAELIVPFTILPHTIDTWVTEGDYHWQKCVGCTVKVNYGSHSDADNDDDHICDTCNLVEASAHSDAAGDSNHTCDECGAENITVHSYTSVVTNPTCTADGYTTYTCSECGHTYTDSKVNASGHTYPTNGGRACTDCGTMLVTYDKKDSTPLNIASGKAAVYTATVNYNNTTEFTDKINLYLGSKELFSLEGTTMKLCGFKVNGEYANGTYGVKVTVNPTQDMVMVEVTLPNGGVVRRGTYELLDSDQTIYAWYTDADDVTNISVTEAAITSGDYTIMDNEPANSDIIYNLVTSFTDARSDRAFAWTAETSNDMVVRYKAENETSWLEADAKQKGSYSGEYFYEADITRLTPSTTYVYQIGTKGEDNWSAEYRFTTAADGIASIFTFAAIGDTQSKTWTEAKLAQAAIAEAMESNPAFMLHTGDFVESDQTLNPKEWNLYFKALGQYGTRVPHFGTSGNHDVWLNTSTSGYLFGQHFNHPNNGVDLSGVPISGNSALQIMTENSKETVYSFDYGNAHFVVLNSGAMDVNNDPKILEAQRQWLIDDLNANSHAKWKIVMFHQPVYHRYDDNYGFDTATLGTQLESLGVDLVIQGHSHLVTRTYPMKNGEIQTKANLDSIAHGTGTVYVTIGSTTTAHDTMGEADYGNNNAEELAVIATPATNRAAYTTVTVDGDVLTVTIKQLNGLVLDQFTISGNNTGGNHTEVNDAEKPATCTETGLTAGSHCSDCGDVITTQTVIPAQGHTYNERASEKVHTEAGCETNAVYYVKCDNCDAVSDEKTVTVAGTALGHKDENTDHICDNGCEVYQGEHADAADDGDHVCDYCGKEVENGESCSDGDDADHNCDVCGKEDISEHVWSEATCTAPKTCSVCGATEGKALGHTYGDPAWDWTGNDTDGYTAATATFDCENCDHEEIVTATVTSQTTDATTEAEGQTVYTATLTFGEKEYTDTKTVTIPKVEVEATFVPTIGNGTSSVTPDENGNVTFKAGTSGPDITVTAPADGWKIGENTFTVASTNNIACVVIMKDADGNYARLTADTDEKTGIHSFKAVLDEKCEIIVAVKGDVNGNGRLDALDARQVVVAVTSGIDNLKLLILDVNNNGRPDALDARQIAMAISGTQFTW